jgi:hypothetical protein
VYTGDGLEKSLRQDARSPLLRNQATTGLTSLLSPS